MKNFDALKSLLATPKKIVITAHANPDGDAIGSALGLYFYLKKFGHKISVIMPTEMPDNFCWMKDFDKILIYELSPTLSDQFFNDADIVFSLDYNGINRVETMSNILASCKAFKVMIDHHINPEDFCDAVLSDTTASSTCQLVYEFIEMMDDKANLDLDILNALYVGILTDTGGFRHATSARLFKIVSEFLDLGVDNNSISNWVFNDYTTKAFKLFAHCISNRLEVLDDLNTGIIVVTQEDHTDFNIQRGDLEGIVNFVLKIQKLKCSVLITERKDIVKLSMRSKEDFSVQEICSKYFNGGGHLNASGGAMRKPLDYVVRRLKRVLEENYSEALQKPMLRQL